MATINSGNSTTLYSTTQTTTSVNTATNLPQDRVNETNFTTLYSNPTAAAQGGGTSGNLLVSGNLRVLGTSDLEGAVTISNSYILPTSDGTTGQVVVTDGNGNLTFQNVSSISSYSIQADTATGGADLTLVGLSTTDSVKFASGTNITVARTDANTITISTVADNIPDGTAAGELLVWDGSAWTANNVVTSLVATDRFIPEFKNIDTSRTSSALFRRNYASTAYTTGLASSIAFQFDSDSQAVTTQGAVGAGYDAANPSIFGATSIDNFTTRTVVFDIDSTNIKFDGTNLVLNSNHTGAPSADVTITVERGTDTDATLTWDETDNRWEFSNDLQVANDLTVDGGNINLNGTATAGVMPFITFATQADGVNSMYGIRGTSTLDDAWFVGSGSTGNDQGYLELATGDNAGGSNDGGQIYARQYNGESSGGAPWYGGGGTVVNEFTLLNNLGYTSIPKRLGINNPNPNFELDITGTVYVAGEYKQTGDNLYINLDGANVDSYLYMKGTSKFLQWDQANQFFRFNDTVYGNNDIIAEDNLATNGNNIWFNYDDVSAADSYLTVKRGGSADVSVRWNQATSRWQFTNDGSTYYNMVINIDDLNDVVITPPVASGQFLVQDGTNWVNSSTVIATAAGDRPRFQYNDSTSGYDSAIFLRKNLGATAYTTGDGTGLGILIASDSQPIQQLASIGATYDATAPVVFLSTNANPNTTGPYITVASFSSAAARLAGSSLTLDSDNTGAAADSYIYANRGSSGADAYLQWSESNSWWGSSASLFAADKVIATNDLATNGNNIYFNYDDGAAADSFLQVKRGGDPDVNIKWNEATDRWQTTVDGTNYLNIPNQNLDTDSNVTFASVTVDGGHTVIDTTTTTTTTTSATAITSTSNATTRSSKFQIQVTDNVTGNIHVLEALIFFQGTTAYLTTYAEMYNSTSLATFTADVDSGNTRLLATAASTNSTTFKVTRISVAL